MHVMDRLGSCLCSVYIFKSSELFFPRNSVLSWTLRIVSLCSPTKYPSGSLILSLDVRVVNCSSCSDLQVLDSCLIPNIPGTEFLPYTLDMGFPGGSAVRYRFDPWIREIPWQRKWKPISVFLPGQSDGQSSHLSWWAKVCGVAKSRKWLCMHVAWIHWNGISRSHGSFPRYLISFPTFFFLFSVLKFDFGHILQTTFYDLKSNF